MFITPNDEPIATFKTGIAMRTCLLICVAGIFILGIASSIYQLLNDTAALYWERKGSVSKPNRPIQSSAVEAGVACPKTQSKLFSGERTSPPYEPDDNIIHVLTTPSYTPSIMGIVYEDCYHYLLKLSPLLMKNLKRSKKLHQLFRKLHQLFQKLHQLFWKLHQLFWKDQSVLTRAKRLLKTLSSEFSYWLNKWTEPRKKIDKTSFHISQIS